MNDKIYSFPSLKENKTTDPGSPLLSSDKSHSHALEEEDILFETKPTLLDYLLFRSHNRLWNGIYCTLIALVIIVFLIVTSIGLVTFVFTEDDDDDSHPFIDGNVYGKNGAVAAENEICSDIGLNILKEKNGNAVDAAIASILCIGTINAFSSGIGGGGVMLVHMHPQPLNASSPPVQEVFDFREIAPLAATPDMFVGNPTGSSVGGLAVAVPGELAGLEVVWQKYGSVPWADLFAPSISLARNGWTVQPILEKRIKGSLQRILDDPGLTSVYAPGGVPKKAGDHISRPTLADTLEKISQEGSIAFYNGSIAQDLLADLEDAGSIITSQDLYQYYFDGGVRINPPITRGFYHGYEIIGATPPFSGGLCIELALNILERYNLPLMTASVPGSPLDSQSYHWILEALAFAFADRMALGDPRFVNVSHIVPDMKSKEHAGDLRARLLPNTTFDYMYYIDLADLTSMINDHGTTHLSVMDKDGNVVALTSTVNDAFGAKVLGLRTGIIFNDEMDDFSTPNTTDNYGLPPNPHNFPAPRKKPLSSMSPTIIVKDNRPYIAIGASGGTIIITSVLQTMLDILFHERNVYKSIAKPRLHYQLLPPFVRAEKGFPQDILDELINRGHKIQMVDYGTLAYVQAVMRKDDGTLVAASDPRKLGRAAAY